MKNLFDFEFTFVGPDWIVKNITMDGLWVWPGHMVHIISTEKGVFLVGNDAWLFEVNGKENLNMD